jgi:c-di-GMP-binding flagellar brake protein YcgR
MGEERRRYKRVPAGSIIWYEIEDHDRMQSGRDQDHVPIHSPLESVDISLGGVQIIADNVLSADKRFKLILSVTPDTPPISILSRVVWCRPGSKSRTFSVGLEFLEFLNGRKKLLENYIERCH